MKLTVLLDNNTLIGRYFLAEPALSFFIEDEGKRILFDTGYSDIFIKNAFKMGIDLRNLDYVALSHGHLDHTWGLVPLVQLYSSAEYEKMDYNKPVIVGHPNVFISKIKDDLAEVGSLLSKEKISRVFELKLCKEPVWITENLVFLGEIKRENPFEGKGVKATLVYQDHKEDDYMMDDSALVYKSSKGIVIITGCSHSGICNIIEQAKRIFPQEPVIDVIGGFHLLNPPKEQLDFTLDYLKKLNLPHIHPCHCTDLNSKIALSKVVDVKQVGVGLSLEY